MVSVLMSVFNEKLLWIKESVESILNQTYTDFEFIIIVDNPRINDEISEFLKKKAREDKRIRLVWNKKNLGLAESLNKGIELASGEYIARMDADDISEKNRLESELKFIRETGYDLVSANKINIDEKDNILSVDLPITRNPNKVLQFSNIIIHPLVFAKTEVLRKMEGYRNLVNSEDFDLWLRMIDKGYKLGILNEYLLKYRIRSNSASVERQLEQFYINKYIIKLKKERKKGGNDSFSIEQQKQYIDKKNITHIKKKRFAHANKNIEKALVEINNGRYCKSLIYIIFGMYFFPNLVFNKIYNYIHSMK